MSALRFFILLWLALTALAGGEAWSPPGGFREAIARKNAVAGVLRLRDPGEEGRLRSVQRAPARRDRSGNRNARHSRLPRSPRP